MKKLTALLFIALAAGGPALAHAGETLIARDGAGPYFRLTLPQSVLASTRSPDLSDLRVLDAQGRALPWAWAPQAQTPVTLRSRAASLFPLPIQQAKGRNGSLTLERITLRPDGTLEWKGGKALPSAAAQAAETWLIDTHQPRANLEAITLNWPENTLGVFPLRLEASNDLRSWAPPNTDSAVVKLKQQGQTLSENRIELGSVRARYLRLQWLGTPVALSGAEVYFLSEPVTPAPALQWSPAWAPHSCDTRSCTWAVPSQVPLDALRLELAQTNTVASVSLQGESELQLPPSPPQRRHPLHGLRHRPPANTEAATPGMHREWLWSGVLWRLPLPDQGESRHSAIILDGQRFERIRLEARQSVGEWGTTPPTLTLGTSRRDIIFLARDPGATRLAWGDPNAAGLPLPIEQLMPLGARSPISPARVNLPEITRPAWRPGAAASAASATATAADSRDGSRNKLWLWAALGAGLLLLAGMAYSLLKATRAPGSNPPPAGD
jgi:hypothetical protein